MAGYDYQQADIQYWNFRVLEEREVPKDELNAHRRARTLRQMEKVGISKEVRDLKI